MTDDLDAIELRAMRFRKLNPLHECFDSTIVLALVAELRQERERAKPQGEPTDAQVRAFLLEEWKHEDWGYDGNDDLPYCACGEVLAINGIEPVQAALESHRVRAALRAAAENNEREETD